MPVVFSGGGGGASSKPRHARLSRSSAASYPHHRMVVCLDRRVVIHRRGPISRVAEGGAASTCSIGSACREYREED